TTSSRVALTALSTTSLSMRLGQPFGATTGTACRVVLPGRISPRPGEYAATHRNVKRPGGLREETPPADNQNMAEGLPGQQDPDGQEPDILPVRFLRVVDARRRLAQGWLSPQPEPIARALILRAALEGRARLMPHRGARAVPPSIWLILRY